MTEQKVAIITGAGSGVGQATAIALAGQGYQLVLVGRREQRLQATAELVGAAVDEAGGGAAGEMLILPADVSDPVACGQIIDAAVEAFGRIDVLANIAGCAPNLPIAEVTPQLWRECIDTNLSSIVYLTQAAWPVFTAQQSGFVVNISSMSSIDPFPGFGIYAAAKAGVNLFTLCTGREGEAIGVQAVAIALGAVETEMLRGVFDEFVVPRDMAMQPAEVAQVILQCLAGTREFKPGETLIVTEA